MKRIVSLLVSAVMLFSMTATAFAGPKWIAQCQMEHICNMMKAGTKFIAIAILPLPKMHAVGRGHIQGF